VIYWYRFDRTSRTWQRHLISHGADCGFDLDPKCVDIDGDGDVDILAPTRNGLFLLENLRLDGEASGWSATARTRLSGSHGHDGLSGRRGPLRPIENAWDWGIRRSHILEGMQRAMGPLPDSSRRVRWTCKC
jgi:hypothetical protein